MHAEYDRESDDYNAHRVVQAFDTAQFIQTTRGDTVLQVLAGDLNTEPNDLAFRILMVASGLRETCNEAECGTIGTNECENNTYTPDQAKEACPNGKRIDYILYRGGINHDVSHFVINFVVEIVFEAFSLIFSDRQKLWNINYRCHSIFQIIK